MTDVKLYVGDLKTIFFQPEAVHDIERHDALIDYAFKKIKPLNATILLYFTHWPRGHVMLVFSELYDFPGRAKYAAAARFFSGSVLSGALELIGV